MDTRESIGLATAATPANEVTTERKPAGKGKRWGKRLGVAGFCFFFFKGLLWLIIPAWVVVERGCVGQ